MLSSVQLMNNNKEITMDEEDIDEGTCFGCYEEIDRECKRCLLEKDCSDERKRREKKKKQVNRDET